MKQKKIKRNRTGSETIEFWMPAGFGLRNVSLQLLVNKRRMKDERKFRFFPFHLSFNLWRPVSELLVPGWKPRYFQLLDFEAFDWFFITVSRRKKIRKSEESEKKGQEGTAPHFNLSFSSARDIAPDLVHHRERVRTWTKSSGVENLSV